MLNLTKLSSTKPKTAIILGSGLGSLADDIEDKVVINYEDIEGFPKTTVEGHSGKLIFGRLNGTEVVCMQGRFHLYEGHPPQIINTVIKAFKDLGVENMIITNAAGSLNPDMAPGSLMLISDHINFSGQNPLIGTNHGGPRFPDMSNPYSLKDKAKAIADKIGIKVFEGIYLMVMGPNFETAAEIKAFRTLGADAVGMSTVPEVLCAVHSGINVLGVSVITNFGTGMKKGSQSHGETIKEGEKASQNLKLLVKEFLKNG